MSRLSRYVSTFLKVNENLFVVKLSRYREFSHDKVSLEIQNR